MEQVILETHGSPQARSKYIVVTLYDEQGTEHTLFRADTSKIMHYQIMKTLRQNLNHHVECQGGGHLQYDEIHKTIQLFGTSCQYGSEDRWRTVRILKNHFPDWTIIEK
ncbi:MAG: hypothetical protein KBC30_10800 [Planctomycetes bacterium]|jgi:hypothetical protein|nr:hypothetical protein [Planctomycetota bacterium]HPY75957.1 hypothetical protein [Planctomycetota bacterium]HQB01506.1 hypothetical protein [Planctomycetota bacterium]